jgi:hypothetical protein
MAFRSETPAACSLPVLSGLGSALSNIAGGRKNCQGKEKASLVLCAQAEGATSMGTYLIVMMGYLHTPAEYRDPEKILRTLTSVAEQGYLITTSEDAFQYWHPEPPVEAGISPVLSADLEAYLAGRKPYFAAEAFAVDGEGRRREFHYGCLALIAEEELLIVTVDDWHFSLPGDVCRDPHHQREVRALYAYWLELLQLTYSIWNPLYCYEPASFWPETSLADARALQPQYLYQYNYFGPELVEKLGRERVLHAPAWLVKSSDDGGAFVIPNDMYYPGEERSDHMPAVARSLQLPFDAAALHRWLERHRHFPGGNAQS